MCSFFCVIKGTESLLATLCYYGLNFLISVSYANENEGSSTRISSQVAHSGFSGLKVGNEVIGVRQWSANWTSHKYKSHPFNTWLPSVLPLLTAWQYGLRTARASGTKPDSCRVFGNNRIPTMNGNHHNRGIGITNSRT